MATIKRHEVDERIEFNPQPLSDEKINTLLTMRLLKVAPDQLRTWD